MTPNNGSGAIYHDHSNTLVGVRHARITEQRGWAAAHAGIWLACSDARRTPSRWRGPSCPRGAAQAAAQWPLAAARRSPRATPGPRYTHQSARITKAIARPFPIPGALRKSILRKLGTPDRCIGLEAGLCGSHDHHRRASDRRSQRSVILGRERRRPSSERRHRVTVRSSGPSEDRKGEGRGRRH